MHLWDKIKDKAIDCLFLLIVLFVLLWGKIFPDTEINN